MILLCGVSCAPVSQPSRYTIIMTMLVSVTFLAKIRLREQQMFRKELGFIAKIILGVDSAGTSCIGLCELVKLGLILLPLVVALRLLGSWPCLGILAIANHMKV